MRSSFLILSLFVATGIASPLNAATPLDHQPAVELRYTGTLAAVRRGEGEAVVKKFTLSAFASRPKAERHEIFFVFNEEGGGEWPWPGRFGALSYTTAWQPQQSFPLRLLYTHDGTPSPVGIPAPILVSPEPLGENSEWQAGRESAEVVGSESRNERDCWKVQVSTNGGRRRMLWVEKSVPLVVACEEKLFLGQGDEFALKMSLESVKPLENAAWDKIGQATAVLAKLRTDMAREPDDIKPELADGQLALASAALETLTPLVPNTALAAISAAMHRDVSGQQQRSDDVSKLASRFVGKAAPDFKLTGLDRKPIDPELLKGKIVVLHFWEYQAEPLLEPYGQVGYLDFLYGKRRKLGVQVVGVAVDEKFGKPDQFASAARGAGRLRTFMNLAYPIATDDGTLLTKFGDPRQVGAKLPLWVVIAPDGKVVHYQSGLYPVHPDEGLKPLDEVLVPLIRDRRAAEKKAGE
jgi:alkyl hydroperoxide reductase subunit AhpC